MSNVASLRQADRRLSPSERRNARKQWELARKAIGHVLEGPVKLEQAGRFRIPTLTTTWRFDRQQELVAFLDRNTGPGLPIDPFLSPTNNAWTIVCRLISLAGFGQVTANLLQHYLQTCYERQNDQVAMYKAPIYLLLAEAFRAVEDVELAQGCFMIAFFEDIIWGRISAHSLNEDRIASASLSKETALDVIKFVEERPEPDRFGPFYPEYAVVRWELETAPGLSLHKIGR